MCTEIKQPHKHAELIIAWARGAKIEYRQTPDQKWSARNTPHWHPDFEYRIKPEPKPDRIKYGAVREDNLGQGYIWDNPQSFCNVKAIFDGETGKLKSVSLL